MRALPTNRGMCTRTVHKFVQQNGKYCMCAVSLMFMQTKFDFPFVPGAHEIPFAKYFLFVFVESTCIYDALHITHAYFVHIYADNDYKSKKYI